MSLGEITCESSSTVYANRWMTVREDKVRFPNGTAGIYGVVDKPDFVAIVPIDAERRVHLVQQFRYPVGARYWEIPQGSWETETDVDPETVALAELREETGLEAGTLTRAGHLFQAYGFSNQGYHLYIATGLVQGEAAREATESDMISAAFGLDEIRQMIAQGAIKDATTIAAFGHLSMTGQLERLFGDAA